MAMTRDYDLLGEVERLTSGNPIASPRRKRDRYGRWRRDDAGELDWLYGLPESERAYLTRRYFSDSGVAVDVLATMADMSVNDWADAFVAAARAARDRTLRDADLFSDEYEEAALSCTLDDVDVSELMGPVEVAKLFGVEVNTIAQWRRRFSDFPAPVVTLSGTYIWRRGDIEAWGAEHRSSVA